MLKIFTVLISAMITRMMGANEQPKYEDAKLDAIMLVDESTSISGDDYAYLIGVVKQLPQTFPLGPTKVRVALVAFSNSHRFIAGGSFVDNRPDFNRAVAELRHKIQRRGTATHLALEAVRNQLLPRMRTNVTKLMLILTDGCTNNAYNAYDHKAMGQAEQIAQQMRHDADIRIFLAYIRTRLCPEHIAEPHQLNIVGQENKDRRFHFNDFSGLTEKIFGEVKKEIEEDRCQYDELCYYPDDTKANCTGHWQLKMTSNKTKCIDEPPITPARCSVDDCKINCEQRWSTGECDDHCQGLPPWCAGACERCTLPDPHGETHTAKPPATDGGGVRVDPRSSPKEPATNWLWLYILLGVWGAVVLVIVILTVAVVQRKRSRRKNEAMSPREEKGEYGRREATTATAARARNRPSPARRQPASIGKQTPGNNTVKPPAKAKTTSAATMPSWKHRQIKR